jgi:DNA-binding GntR family transcriptional regulator
MSSNALLQKPDTLRSHVEKFLREAIMEGRFKPGERLIERELCEMLQVSRPPLREALRKLEAEKLIVTVMHRGPIVASITEQEARELYAMRALLEGFAVEEFTRRVDDSLVAKLGEAVQGLHAAAKKDDRSVLLAAKAQMYDIILEGSGNSIARETLLSLLSRINLLRAASFSAPDRLVKSLREIDHLYERIKARDAIGAKQATYQHVANAEAAALAVLTQQGSS